MRGAKAVTASDRSSAREREGESERERQRAEKSSYYVKNRKKNINNIWIVVYVVCVVRIQTHTKLLFCRVEDL